MFASFCRDGRVCLKIRGAPTLAGFLLVPFKPTSKRVPSTKTHPAANQRSVRTSQEPACQLFTLNNQSLLFFDPSFPLPFCQTSTLVHSKWQPLTIRAPPFCVQAGSQCHLAVIGVDLSSEMLRSDEWEAIYVAVLARWVWATQRGDVKHMVPFRTLLLRLRAGLPTWAPILMLQEFLGLECRLR